MVFKYTLYFVNIIMNHQWLPSVFHSVGDRTAELAADLKVIDVDNSFCKV